MELDFVTFEQAKALKDVGFPQKLDKFETYKSFYSNINGGFWAKPTLEEAAKWLREEKGILTIPKYIIRIPNEFIYQDWVKIKNRTGFFTTGKIFSAYEQALSAGIDEAIKLLKKDYEIH